MKDLSSLMHGAYPSRNRSGIAAARAFAAWIACVSTRIADNARPIRLRNGVLTIHTATSAWAHSLDFEAEEILSRMRSRSPDLEIDRIAFRVGALPSLSTSSSPESRPRPIVPLAQLPEPLARELSHIRDDELREKIARAAAMEMGTPKKPETPENDD
jgi:hypothetical protein